MDPSRLIPAADPIPVSWGWFQILLLLTFFLHLLFMNTMLGTGIIAFISHLKRPGSDSPRVLNISKQLPYAIAFTVNLGVAPLLFLQVLYGHFFYVSSVLMAQYWISIVALLLIAYYSAYIYDFRYEALGSARIFFIGTTVLTLLTVGFLFTNNLTLMLHPEAWKAYFERPDGTLLNLSDPTLVPRYLHFITASIAVGGLFIALVARFKSPRGSSRASGTGEQEMERTGKNRGGGDEKNDRIALGMDWFCYATLVQILIGLWFLISLPSEITMLFLGKKALHSTLFLAGIAGALLSLAFGFKRLVLPATLSVLGTIIFMIMVRDLVRKAYLEPYFSLSSLKVVPQSTPLILFLCCFAAGLVVMGFILKTAAKSGKGA